MSVTNLSIDAIIIGSRARKDMGDIKGLADSITKHGLLHPVVVRHDKTLIAGHRRIEAVRLLGWKDVSVNMIDVTDMLSAERDENEARKSFTPSEAVAIGKMIEEQVRPQVEAARRQKISAAKRGEMVVKSPPSKNTRDIVAKAVGMPEQKYRYAKSVIAAAESDPAKFGDLPAKMDGSGNVSGVFREMERRKSGASPNKEFTGKRVKRSGVRSNKTAPYEPKTKKQIDNANGQKRRLVYSLSKITGICRGLNELDVPMAVSVCDANEVKVWANRSRDLSRMLRTLSLKLAAGGE